MKVRKGHSFDRVSLRTAVREHLTAQINYDPKSTIKDVLKYFSKSDLAAELSETRDKRSKQYKAALRNVERWTTGGKEKRTPGRIYQKRLVSLLRSQDEVLKNQAARTEDITVKVTADITISNDVQRNLQVPLEGIQAELKALGLPEVNIRTLVRTGDTPAAERTAMTKRPPHIVVTTPESLYILLTSEGGRRMLETARTLILDEIHA